MSANPFISLFKVQMLSSLRSFPSVFYTIILPVVLFLIFGAVFNVDGEYAHFFLPGMIGVMVSSDALFAVGPVMKEYFRQGIVREFRTYPFPLSWLFITFILTRLIFVMASATLLIFVSAVAFNYVPTASETSRFILAVLPAYASYSFIALIFSFWGIQDNRDQALISLYYFLGMFMSDAFISLSARWPILDVTGYIFPLKPALEFMRGDWNKFPIQIIWTGIAFGAFWHLTRSLRLKRR